MTFHVAVLTAAAADREIAGVACASVTAWLKANAPTADVSWHRFVPGQSLTLELDLCRRMPSLLAVWCQAGPPEGLDDLLARLRPLHPAAVIALFGPALVDRRDAEDLLARHLEADITVRGEPEAALLELCLALEAGPAAWSEISGLSTRRDGRVYHGPERTRLLDPAELPSPWLTGLLEPPRRGTGAVRLEMLRGAIPFSPLSLRLQPAPPRPIPLERLELELVGLLEARVPELHLLSSPADALPGHLHAVLNLLIALNRQTYVGLELDRLPSPELAGKLREAGVAWLIVRHPPGGQADRGGGRMLDRAALKALRDLGIRVTLRVPVGRQGDSGEVIRRRLDGYITYPVDRIELEPLRLWPGHPWRRTPDAAHSGSAGDTPTALVAAGAPSYQVLANEDLPFDQLEALEAWRAPLHLFRSVFPGSLKLLARACGLSLPTLLWQLMTWFQRRYARGLSRDGLADRARVLLSFARAELERAGKVDRIPLILTALDFEQWLNIPGRALATPRSVAYDMNDLDAAILARTPGVELRTFPYDVLRLIDRLDIEEAPVHRSHVLLRRQGPRPALATSVSEMQKTLLEAVDGSRTVGELLDRVKSPPQGNTDGSIVQNGLLSLLEHGILFVKARSQEPPPDVRQPGRRKILPFRARSSGRSPRDGDSGLSATGPGPRDTR